MEPKPPNRIRALRDDRSWSVRDLEQRTGINFSILNRVERGTQPLDYPRMQKIARAFGVRVSELLNDEDVELRASDQGQAVLAELDDIPRDQLLPFLTATREMLNVARNLAAQRSAAALGGDVRQIGALAESWNRWDDGRREKALKLLALMDDIEG